MTFAGNITSTPSAQHKEILDKLHKIYFEESKSTAQVNAMAQAMERLMDKRNQRRITSMLKQVVRCQSSKELCDAEDKIIAYAATPTLQKT